MKKLYQIIKASFFLLAIICTSMCINAQEINSIHRDLPVTIRNNKTRPVRNVFVASHSTGKAGLTNRSGRFVFRNLPINDTISMELPNYGVVVIPIAGMDSIEVTVPEGNRNRYSFIRSSRQNATIESRNNNTNNVIDVQEILKKRQYESVSDLINEEFRKGSRGVLTFSGSSEPLVVINGTPAGTITDANGMINVRDIKTMEVKKNGNEWGSRGANGVILINTR